MTSITKPKVVVEVEPTTECDETLEAGSEEKSESKGSEEASSDSANESSESES